MVVGVELILREELGVAGLAHHALGEQGPFKENPRRGEAHVLVDHPDDARRLGHLDDLQRLGVATYPQRRRRVPLLLPTTVVATGAGTPARSGRPTTARLRPHLTPALPWRRRLGAIAAGRVARRQADVLNRSPSPGLAVRDRQVFCDWVRAASRPP